MSRLGWEATSVLEICGISDGFFLAYCEKLRHAVFSVAYFASVLASASRVFPQEFSSVVLALAAQTAFPVDLKIQHVNSSSNGWSLGPFLFYR